MMYFIYNFLTNMFRPLLRLSSVWCYYYKNIALKIAATVAETCWWENC